jgi:hypothetical protein
MTNAERAQKLADELCQEYDRLTVGPVAHNGTQAGWAKHVIASKIEKAINDREQEIMISLGKVITYEQNQKS